MPALISKKKDLDASSLTLIGSFDLICPSSRLAGCHA
jgi:hypothetical protein